MLTSSYDASFGRNPGAQVNVVLNSGGNNVHGTAFEFFRNAALDARNVFAPSTEPKPKYIRNQFGGSIGGPIKPRSHHSSLLITKARVLEKASRALTNVPTLEERKG
jgi:hypothetical protein